MTPVTCDCFSALPGYREMAQNIYCILQNIDENTGGGGGGSTYTSHPINATADFSIPAGVYGWSLTTISGTVTVGGKTLPAGGSMSGGGYGGKTSAAAIAVTVSGGSVIGNYDN